MPTTLECWEYNGISVKESFEEKMPLCEQDPFCKGRIPAKDVDRRMCKHFDSIYVEKWRKFLK